MEEVVDEIAKSIAERIAEQQETAQLEHLKRRKLVTRIKLNKANEKGYATLQEQYEHDEDLWLDKHDTLGENPVEVKPGPPSLRRQMFENINIVDTTQRGSTSRRTVPAIHHPEYQATLEKSDSVAENRRCERGKIFRKKTMNRRTVQEEDAGDVYLDRQQHLKCQACDKLPPDASNAWRTIQITSRFVRTRVYLVGKILSKEASGLMRAAVTQDGMSSDGMQIIDEINLVEKDWRRTLQRQECYETLPGSDLLYARCEDHGHRSWICVRCFEDQPDDKSIREELAIIQQQDPQPGRWWSIHSQGRWQSSQSHSSSGWNGSYRDTTKSARESTQLMHRLINRHRITQTKTSRTIARTYIYIHLHLLHLL